ACGRRRQGRTHRRSDRSHGRHAGKHRTGGDRLRKPLYLKRFGNRLTVILSVLAKDLGSSSGGRRCFGIPQHDAYRVDHFSRLMSDVSSAICSIASSTSLASNTPSSSSASSAAFCSAIFLFGPHALV